MEEIEVFDRPAVRAHRARAARLVGRVEPVLADLAERLLDRLEDTTHRFARALDLGGRGTVAAGLRARGMEVVSLDVAAPMARIAGGLPVAAEFDLLPFAPGSFDLVVASCALHWANDLPGALIQLRQCLRPDGLLLASLPVLGTLGALRDGLTEAELALRGGASPRVSPFATLQDCAGLLQRAGFALPVADMESISFSYGDRLALLADLRAAGETNAVRLRSRCFAPRALLPMALAGLPERAGRAELVLQLAYLTGWAPAAGQPKPAARGSGQVSLAAVLGEEGLAGQAMMDGSGDGL